MRATTCRSWARPGGAVGALRQIPRHGKFQIGKFRIVDGPQLGGSARGRAALRRKSLRRRSRHEGADALGLRKSPNSVRGRSAGSGRVRGHAQRRRNPWPQQSCPRLLPSRGRRSRRRALFCPQVQKRKSRALSPGAIFASARQSSRGGRWPVYACAPFRFPSWGRERPQGPQGPRRRRERP